MTFNIYELRVLSFIVTNAEQGAWYRRGAKCMAEALIKPVPEIKAIINALEQGGYLEFDFDVGNNRTGVRITERGQRERVRQFKHLFPDVERVILRKNGHFPK